LITCWDELFYTKKISSCEMSSPRRILLYLGSIIG
jgi:hypothetical protein